MRVVIITEKSPYSSSEIEDIKNGISKKLDVVLRNSSNGTMQGSVSFKGAINEHRLVPSIEFYGTKHEGGPDDPMIGGRNEMGGIGINYYNKDGSLKVLMT